MMISKVTATVLIVEDLEKCIAFYRDMVGLEVTFRDDVSMGFRLIGQDFVLLSVPAAMAQISEEAVGSGTATVHRAFLCAEAESADAVYEALTAKGVKFIKPPKDQAWGRRTAYFADPEGNLWEIYQSI
ncbi:MAG: VOC family protein [Chloroflexota bacterium]